MPACPKCSGRDVVKNGKIKSGKQRYKCKGCNLPFVENPSERRVSRETKDLIDKLFLERLSLKAIHRATGVAVS